MKLFLKLAFVFAFSVSLLNCSNQKTEGKGKLRLHTMYLSKADVLNLGQDETLYFNIDFENRKVAKEHLRLAGFKYKRGTSKTSAIDLISVGDTVVEKNKIFGNYFLKKDVITKIKQMHTEGALSHTDHFILKPLLDDPSLKYISYDLLVGSNDQVFSSKTAAAPGTSPVGPGVVQAAKAFTKLDRLDPSPPAPPQY